VDGTVMRRLAAENDDMGSLDRLANIYWAVDQALTFDVPGDLVEVGCNAGLTSVFLQMLNRAGSGRRELHVYDSFQGLPPPGPHDATLGAGDCAATVADLRATFERWALPLPTIHAGWFHETLPDGLPPSICFAYLDGDFYESIRVSLEHVWPRTAPGGLVFIDDYADTRISPDAWDGLPGVRKAVDEFFAGRPERPVVLAGSGDLALVSIRKALT
jgi:O-methyltransferase